MIGIGQKKPDPPMPKMPTEKVTICSVLPRTAFNSQVAGRYFELAECPKCEMHEKSPCESCDNYAKLVVGAVVEGVDTPMAADGSGRELRIIPAKDIAESLTHSECLDRGVFVAAGDVPTHEELVAARQAFVTWGEALVRQSDDIWGAKKDAKLIDPRAHDCAKYLGLNREWLSNTAAQIACRICGKYAKSGVILGECGHPVDWKQAESLGLLDQKWRAFGVAQGLIEGQARPAVEEPPSLNPVAFKKRGRGRPRKVDPTTDLTL